MQSIPYLSTRMKRLFEQDAVELAHQAGLRQRTIPLSKLVLVLVLGWWYLPRSGPSALARFAGGLDLHISKQGVFAYPPETVYSFRGDMQKPPSSTNTALNGCIHEGCAGLIPTTSCTARRNTASNQSALRWVK